MVPNKTFPFKSTFSILAVTMLGWLVRPMTVVAAEKPFAARHAMIVSADARANTAGMQILQKGGNAVDAAVAVAFSLAVTFPEAGNIGGGGFMLVRMHTGEAVVIDFRETAPTGASRTMYIDRAGNVSGDSFDGCRSSGVPGTVAGLLKGLELYGTFDRARVMAPAIRLAEGGLRVNERLANQFVAYQEALLRYPSTRKFLVRRGELPHEGDRIDLSSLAGTLRRIQKQGAAGFYTGETAKMIVAEMSDGGGLLTMEDLATYKPVVRQPLQGSYRGFDILTSPPPSSGGVCLLEAANILEGYKLGSFGYHSAQAVLRMSEALKRSYADRAQFLGDPAFVPMPLKELISKGYAARRRTKIDTLHATGARDVSYGDMSDIEGNNTTHISVIDAEGNAVSITYTLNDLFGSKVVVDGAGFFMNDEMDDFSAKPGVPNVYGLIGGEANAIAPGKRPLSSMAPTIVLKDKKPVLILGARGGSRIISAVLQTIVDVVDYGMNIQEAVTMPRFHHQWLPDTLVYERYAFTNETLDALGNLGYASKELPVPNAGSLECIYIDPITGIRYAGADPREGGAAAGY